MLSWTAGSYVVDVLILIISINKQDVGVADPPMTPPRVACGGGNFS